MTRGTYRRCSEQTRSQLTVGLCREYPSDSVVSFVSRGMLLEGPSCSRHVRRTVNRGFLRAEDDVHGGPCEPMHAMVVLQKESRIASRCQGEPSRTAYCQDNSTIGSSGLCSVGLRGSENLNGSSARRAQGSMTTPGPRTRRL